MNPTTMTEFRDIQFLRVAGEGLDPLLLDAVRLMQWGADNAAAILVGFLIGALLSWAGRRIGQPTI